MNGIARAKDFDFKLGKIMGGITYYPYQISFGFTLRYFPHVFVPSIRLHIFCFKIWFAWKQK